MQIAAMNSVLDRGTRNGNTTFLSPYGQECLVWKPEKYVHLAISINHVEMATLIRAN